MRACSAFGAFVCITWSPPFGCNQLVRSPFVHLALSSTQPPAPYLLSLAFALFSFCIRFMISLFTKK